jgi:RNA polymerase sigma factor (sigma-70 family)
MRSGGLRKVLDHLRLADGGGLTDGQLLGRFLDGREEAAFAALVRRHGPMVLGVCRRVLGHAHDAEDAFQATFLLLARKAASVVRREALGGWLYRVAYRTALEARVRAQRRRARERQVDEIPHPEVAPAEAQDWRPLLDRELDLLPEKYRVAVVLCDLEGRTRREAARQLGLSEGTLSSHLTRARRLLARRLTRQGMTLSGGALAVALAEGAAAAVPAPLVSATARAAALAAAGKAAALATPAAALMNEVAKAMLMTKLKLAVAGVLAVALLGAGGVAYRAAGQAPAAERAGEARPLTEVESLRRQVELLRFNLEVVLEKCRAQEGELRALRAGARANADTRERAIAGELRHLREQQEAVRARELAGHELMPEKLDAERRKLDAELKNLKEGRERILIDEARARDVELRGRVVADPTQEAENALKALREARGPQAKRRAAEALERATKRLREQLQLQPADSTAPQKQ